MEAQKKVVIVAGAGGGLGGAIAQALAGPYRVVGVGRSSPEQSVCEHFFVCDLSDHAQTLDMAKRARELGPAYAVINSIGPCPMPPLWKLSPQDWAETLNGHLGSCFNLLSAFAPGMRERSEGRFVFLSSVVAKRGAFGASHYAAAKGGIEALTRSAALELGNKGITVNAVSPGYMDSGVIRHVPEPMLQEILQRVPLKKLGPSSEVGALVRHLLSPEASFMTGQVIGLDGGY
jgi:acetoacetyl-CoA reductase